MKEENVFFHSRAVQLEGLLSVQEAFSFRAGLVCCHPHPEYGGDMHNGVVAAAVEAGSSEGYSTLRFNFRGVGRSGGSYEEGIGEREDVVAAVDYLGTRLAGCEPSQQGSGNRFTLMGYNFGAWVGLPVATEDERITGMAAVAPPLGLYNFDFLKGCRKAKMVVVGEKDMFCPVSLLEPWYRGLEEPKELRIIKGADHFFFSHHSTLVQTLREFLRTERRGDTETR
jgi:hypothetical protein